MRTELKFINSNALRINRIRNVVETTENMAFIIDLCSVELLTNELESNRVIRRYNGEISNSVNQILTNVLKTEKPIDSDATSNHYSFIGEYRKPLDLCTYLASCSIPNIPNSKGKTAGYFFFETYDGFKFKSIDKLFEENRKYKSFIQNDTTKLPSGYDGKILKIQKDVNIDAFQKLDIGAYGIKLKYYDPYEQLFKENAGITANQQSLLAGKNSYSLGEDLNDFTRIEYRNLDKGNLPLGNTAKDRAAQANVENLDTRDIVVQSSMRYNQLFTIKYIITIYGDFSLRAGDLIYCDFPQLSYNSMQMYSPKSSGIYMIADVCHLISPRGPSNSLTRLSLVRDSDGRKPQKIKL